ncbi:MAG: hydantoinase/oxoprolinase family protein [Actinomycetota bacterium]|nr:hydantoinase/oxoprolinase family protein [Actinomycetota bacterium]
MSARVGIDVGGTFTDLVALTGEGIVTAKVPSTPGDQSEGVMNVLTAAAVEEAVKVLAHGTTVGTNTLLERKGARTALVTTEGFRDIIEIGRQDRPSLYDLTASRPPALVARDLRFTVHERMGPEGEIEPLDEAALEKVSSRIAESGAEAVAVCFLFAFLHPAHERRATELLRARLPEVPVLASSEVVAEFREFERFSTTVAAAYLTPALSSYLGRLKARCEDAGLPAPLVMQSSGGILDIEEAGANPAGCVLSGPAGGVVAAAHSAARSGFSDAVSFDMGGTSTDVAPIIEGRVATSTESVVAGVPLKLPMVDVHTVSAGGGSIAWVDEGGGLRVGPGSAGADPGPAAYGRGGDSPTVTDADLILGYLADGATMGGEVKLDGERSAGVLAALGDALKLDLTETALGVVRVAEAEMARALRVVTVERGIDPRDFALVAFGGAGPMHACALAEELSMRAVLVPSASGVLSALGLALSDIRRDRVVAVHRPLDREAGPVLEGAFAELEQQASAENSSSERFADLRYAAQSHELTVEAQDLSDLRTRFDEQHERRYGYAMPEESVEVVSVRSVETVAAEGPGLPAAPRSNDGRSSRRRINLDGNWIEAPVWQRSDMGAGSELEGPAVVELAEATCVVRPRWKGQVDDSGTLVLRALDA